MYLCSLPQDIEKITAVLGTAFLESPSPGGMIKDTVRRKKAVYMVWKLILDMRDDVLEVTADSPACNCCAIWDKTGLPDAGPEMIEPLLTVMTEEELQIQGEILNDFIENREALNLPDDTEYLVGAGTLPEYRGRGLASSLIRERMKLTDAEGRAIYLETNAEYDAALYRHLGFAVQRKEYNPRTGVMSWYMVHYPEKP
ncbi:MAG TPA: GNAT family N-acetyltransferase [Methanocorpusculum sp.]|nr:GNAT family N-acetyltransferase [Methanocorpusculum sp.]